MLRNLTISPELDKEDWDPDVITRMIIIAPGAHVSESEIVNELHMLDLPLTIKNTCYGSMVSGKTKDVFEAIHEIRKLDPITFSQKKEVLLLEILEDAEATDLDQEKVSTKWKMNTDYLVMWQMLWKILVMWKLKLKNRLMLMNLKKL